jgi:hypothetical protein
MTVATGVTTSGVPGGSDSLRVVGPLNTSMVSLVGEVAAVAGDGLKMIAPPRARSRGSAI